MIGCIFFTSFQIGHLPVYGLDADPTASGLMGITLVLFLFFTSLMMMTPPWLIMGVFFSIQEKSWKLFFNRYSIIIIVGILIFFSIKYCMLEQFAWYFD